MVKWVGSFLFLSFLLLGSLPTVSADEVDDPSRYKTRDDFLRANALYGVKYYFSPNGRVFTKDDVDITPPEMLKELEEHPLGPSIFDFLGRLLIGGDLREFQDPMPPTGQDQWNFLPDFKPGESVYENMETPADAVPIAGNENIEAPPLQPSPQPKSAGPRKGRGYFGKEYAPKDSTSSEPAKDPAPLAEDAAPLAEPEPMKADEPQETPLPAPDFSQGSLESYNEPEPKEIDYRKYGSFVTYDHISGEVAAHDAGAGTKTSFQQRQDVHFGDPRGGTVAVTTRDRVVIHEDYYDHLGNLTRSVSVDPATGIRTSTIYHPDGTTRMEQTHADGKPVVNKVSTTDPNTGETTTAEGNPDGTRTVTKTDREGHVIEQEVKGAQDSDTLIEGSSTDPETGITRSGKRLKDGTTEIAITDKDGNAIGTERRDASGKLMSQALPSAGDSFSQFDSTSRGFMSQLNDPIGTMTPAAALDGGPSSRNIAFGSGTMSQNQPSSQHPDCPEGKG
jgi:hypothetical protein